MTPRALLSATAALAGFALAIGGAVAPLAAEPALAVPPSADRLAVSMVGTAGGTLSGAAAPGSIVLLGADGSVSSTVSLPTATSGSQRTITFSGSSAQTGTLHQSVDHSVVAIAGFGDAVGTGNPQNATTARTIATVDAQGTVDSTTSLGTAFSGSYVRGVATVDGSTFWAGGKGDGSGLRAGVVSVAKGGSSPTAISVDAANTAYNNARVPVISGGSLYVSSDRAGYSGVDLVSASLPTSAVSSAPTVVAATPSGSDTPHDFVFVGDSLYVTYTSGTAGLAKYVRSSGSWSQVGFVAGAYWGVTGRVAGSGVVLYAVKGAGSGNTLTQLFDSGGANAFTAVESTIATAASGTTYRGVAFAPGFTPGTGPALGVTAVNPTLTLAASGLTTEVGDTSTTSVAVSQPNTDAATVSVSATISTSGIATVAVTGSGASRTLSVTGTGIGRANVSVTAINVDGGSTTVTIPIGVSGATPALTNPRYLTGASNASTAIDVGGGYALVGDDESATLRLYDVTHGGAAAASWDFSGQIGVSGEIDIEASARIGNTIYWSGSASNNKRGVYQPSRSTIFATTVSGSGAATTLSFAGVFTGVREALVAWPGAASVGLDRACVTSGTVMPDVSTGCNIEGMEIAPDGSTAYLGFRSPTDGGRAVVVPLTNLAALTSTRGTAPTFGTAFTLDLGGRSIRELRKNSADQYLITAGVPDDVATAQPGLGWALYAWDGRAADAPVLLQALPASTGSTDGQETGSWETIVAVPTGYTGTATLITDNGTTVYYADGTAAKDVPDALQKSRVQDVSLSGLPGTGSGSGSGSTSGSGSNSASSSGSTGSGASTGASPAAALSATTSAPGQQITVTAGGFLPGETVRVELHSTPRVLGTTVAAADGTIRAAFTIPADAPAGAHEIWAIGLTSGRTVVLPLGLAATGGSLPIATLSLALVLTLTGGLLVWSRRRRVRRDAAERMPSA